MFRTFAWLIAASSALWLSSAIGLGLGEIEVKSKLNQRFSASIPLTSVSFDEAETAQISLASNADFERAGIDRTEYLSTLRFVVTNGSDGPRIVVSSQQATREPFLSFLLEYRGKNGRLMREYTVLLDPPEQPAPPPSAVAKADKKPATPTEFYETPEERARQFTAASPAPPPAASKPAPQASTPAAATPKPAEPPYVFSPSPSVAGGSSYGPVQAKETLWSIATKLRPDPSISMDQVLLALYRSNPQSFDGFQGLHKGTVLTVPSADEMRATSPGVAKARVNELRGGSAAAPRKPRGKQPELAAAPVLAPDVIVPVIPPVETKPAAKKPPTAVLPPIPVIEKKPERVVPPAPEPAPVIKKPEVVAPPVMVPPKPQPAPAVAPAVVVEPPPVAVTPPPTPAPPPAEVQAAEPLIATPAIDEPLIPPPAAVVEKPAEPVAPVVPPPAVVEEAAESSSGLYLWLGVGALLLGGLGFGGYRYLKTHGGGKVFPSSVKDMVAATTAAVKTKIAPTASPAAPAAPQPVRLSAESERMQDTAMDDTSGHMATQVFDSTREQPAQKYDSTLAMTGQQQKYNSTQSIDSAANRTMQPVPASEHVDFDVTSQFASETMSINLDANDPVSEADFHLAYGLYDEAALLLKQAAEKDPGRTDVRVKLAETYFAASRPEEFVQVAQTLKSQLPDAEWQKLAIMGRQLAPDADIFAGGDDAALSGDIDLSFDEPDPQPSAAPKKATLDFSFDEPEQEAAPTLSARPAATPMDDLGGGLDFKLEELELPRLEDTRLEMPTTSSNSLDFKLSDIDLTPAPSPSRSLDFSSTSPGTAEVHLAEQKNFASTGSMQTVALNLGGDEASLDDEVRLDDFDLGEASSAISAGDEAGTKLDLARAYADMGDNDMARTLLKEVQQQGTPEQQREAQGLISRLA